MDAGTLSAAMGGKLPAAKYAAYVDDFNRALTAADCTTVKRAAMFCAQVGHESLGLYYMEEIASGAAYEGRRDLGNTQPGDGKRFKGRGPIQLTGRANYRAFTDWARRQGNAPDFTVEPQLVAQPQWGFLAASWYWTVERPKLNARADAGDVFSASCDVNGWIKLKDGTWRTPNGYADRTARWHTCLRLGNALLPTAAPTAAAQENDMPSVPEVTQGVWSAPIDDVYTTRPDDRMPAFATLAWACAHAAYARQAAERCERKLDQVLEALAK